MKTIRWIVLTVVIVGLALGVAARSAVAQEQDDTLSADARSLLYEVRGETADFRDVDLALEAGYGKFLDCFTLGDEMGMGQHYVNGELAGDDVLDALRPEALVYEPRHDGSMILVAFEYLVFADVWDPHNTGREAPMLFGQAFHLKTNIPETPPVWALHLWLWSHNPEGLFADYSPIVSCPDDQPVIDMSMS